MSSTDDIVTKRLYCKTCGKPMSERRRPLRSFKPDTGAQLIERRWVCSAARWWNLGAWGIGKTHDDFYLTDTDTAHAAETSP